MIINSSICSAISHCYYKIATHLGRVVSIDIQLQKLNEPREWYQVSFWNSQVQIYGDFPEDQRIINSH